MGRTLMVSDVHGCLEPLERLLIEVDYDSSRDRLILLGDYVDKGPRSKEVVERVMNLVEQHGAVALRGNHDQRLVELIRKPHAEVRTKFVEHGGVQTLNSYLNREDAQLSGDRLQEAIAFIDAAYPSHLRFLASLPYYYEDDRQICVHAGLNPQYSDWRSQPAHDFMYIKKEFYKAPTRVGKKVVFGHTRAQELHDSPEIWFGGDKIGIDGGCAYGHQLNCLIEESGSYSTHAVRNPL